MTSFEGISDLGFAFMGSKALFGGLHINVFTHISEGQGGAKTIAELAAITDVNERKLTTLVTSLISVGLLEMDAASGKLSNAPASEKFLVKGSKADFGDYLKYQISKQMYTMMGNVESVLDGKGNKTEFEDYSKWFANEEEAALYSHSQHAGSVGPAKSLARLLALDQSQAVKMLDVGGGTGAFSITMAQKYPNLKATVLDFPNVVAQGMKYVKEGGVEGRVSYLGSDANETNTAWPEGQDLVLMSYLSSSVSADDLPDLYSRAYKCLAPGGRLLIHDFMVENDRKGPACAALWALQHMCFTPGGTAITPAWLTGVVTQCGFTADKVEYHQLIPELTKVAICTK